MNGRGRTETIHGMKIQLEVTGETCSIKNQYNHMILKLFNAKRKARYKKLIQNGQTRSANI